MATIDPDDTEFLALSEYLDCFTWTGDKKQHNKLLAKIYEGLFLPLIYGNCAKH